MSPDPESRPVNAGHAEWLRLKEQGELPEFVEKETSDEEDSRSFADLAKEAEEKPLVWLVPSTLIEGGAHLIHGKEESYKTTFVMQLLEALNLGGRFLGWDIEGGLRVGFAELEMTEKIFRQRVRDFMKPAQTKPDIKVLSEKRRLQILDGATTKARVKVLLDWVKKENLDVLGIDSVAKLFPPTSNTGSQPVVSDLFGQFQKLGCTVIVIAHPRKSQPTQLPQITGNGNEEIAGSGRFAQDPDLILEITRPDRRAPKTVLSWGKNRMGDKPEDMPLYFDKVDFRLYPQHPFLHLLPESRERLIASAEVRFGWKQRRAEEAITELKQLQDTDGNTLIEETVEDRRVSFRFRKNPPPCISVKVSADVRTRTSCDTPTEPGLAEFAQRGEGRA